MRRWIPVAAGIVLIACGAAIQNPPPAVPMGAAPARSVAPPPTSASATASAPAPTASPPLPPPSASAPPPPPPGPGAGKTAVGIVSRMPEIKSYCASLERAPQRSRCTMWSEDEQAPAIGCTAGATFLDDCLWPVYVGESQRTHTVRFATMWVNLNSGAVVGVSDWACGRMPVDTWRAWRADTSPNKDCPEDAK